MSNSAKLQAIIEEQNQVFIARRDEIWAAWCALLTSEHMFLLGPWGVAKSMLINDIVRRISGAKLFDYLMFKDTARTELTGPLNIEKLQQGSYQFILKDGIAEAHIVFLDEMWKANSGVLNSGLGMMNERKLRNGTAGVVDVPLISLFAASNELPESEEVYAVYDRILFRMQVRDLDSNSDFLKLIQSEPVLNGNPTTLSLDELRGLQATVNKVVIPEPVQFKIVELRHEMKNQGIFIYPRRWLKGIKAVRANAFLSGRMTAELEDLEIFQHILWETPEQIAKVRQTIFGMANPVRMEIVAILDKAESAYQEIVRIDNLSKSGNEVPDKDVIMVEHQQKIKRLTKELKDLVATRKMSDNTEAEAKAVLVKVQRLNRQAAETALGLEPEHA